MEPISILFKIGDRVTVTIDRESRSWSRNGRYPFNDGDEAIIIDIPQHILFHERIGIGAYRQFGGPGVFTGTGTATLYFPNTGHTVIGIGYSDMTLMDAEEALVRKLAGDALFQQYGYKRAPIPTPISELPPTKFWEGDTVRLIGSRNQINHDDPDNPKIFVVTRIDYHALHRTADAKTPLAFYSISGSLGAGWNSFAAEDELELVSRGKVWDWYHGNPISFDNIEDEARFYGLVGQTHEIRNDKTESYAWSLEDALRAIEDGIADSINVSSLFGSGPTTHVYRFYDREVGRRVADATLKGFDRK